MIEDLPERPGVYLFKDKKGKIIYIGKALNIKKRVKDHLLLKNKSHRYKNLAADVSEVSCVKVDSEIEALLLEANLIKKHKPIYNVQLKDDKDYLYIKITDEVFPRVLTVRKKDLAGAKIFYGPFPSAAKVKTTLKTLRKVFPFSTCKPNQKRPCLAYHLKLCPGVCAGQISPENYSKNIKALNLILSGRKNTLEAQIGRTMNIYSKRKEYEKAAEEQKKLQALGYITRPIRNPQDYLDQDINLLRQKELRSIAAVLGLDRLPRRIECYDISNLMGKQAVGSMVVFIFGEPAKEEYRRFKIKKVVGINDTAMLREVLQRRFSNNWELPDLIVVDGGKGQLNTAQAVIKDLSLNIPVISLAKRFEEVYQVAKKGPTRLPRSGDALKLLQRLRDEAHRFAVVYHRNVRRREFLPA